MDPCRKCKRDIKNCGMPKSFRIQCGIDQIRCKCNGVPKKGNICMWVTVGGEFCKANFDCKHQEK